MKDEHLIHIRKAAAAGQYYPQSKTELRLMVNTMFDAVKIRPIKNRIQALIVPHAGYIFSGKVAAHAYLHLNTEAHYENIFFIASSHYTSFEGASIFAGDTYETPLGSIDVNKTTVAQLNRTCECFEFYEHAHHKEHSIEVQIPFIQTRLKHPSPIVPIILGTENTSVCKRIATALAPFFNEKNLFIVSTDLSHYPSYEDALTIDASMCGAITSNNVDVFLSTRQDIINQGVNNLITPICGWTSVLTLLYLTRTAPYIFHQVNYRNSGDAKPFGEEQKVVGYGAFVVTT